MKWLRWKGLIAFILIWAIFMVFWFVLIEVIVRGAMENTATILVGAEVNIDDVDLKFSPLGATIQRIQVTDPDDPRRNAIEIKSLAFSLETIQLFLRKVIIDEMSVIGMAFGTKREKPGFIKKVHKKEKLPPGEKAPLLPALPSFSQDDIVKILESEDLKTLRLIKSIRKETQERKAFWEKRLGEIPDKEQLTTYQERIEQLKNIDKRDPQSILAATARIKSLQNDITSDIRVLEDARTRFNNDFTAISTQIKQLGDAPGEDVSTLVEKYGPTSRGLGNVSAVLFGETIGVWVERSLFWYQKINPILQRGEKEEKGKKVTKPLRAAGFDVHFKEHSPLPDFLIRRTAAAINLEQGSVKGNLFNITTDQDILGSPVTFDFSGDKLRGLASLRLDGSLNRIDPGQSIDKLDLSLKGYGLQGVDLGAGTLPVTLEKGTASIDLSTDIVNERISAELKSTISSVKLTVPETADTSGIYSSVSSAISRVDTFTIQAFLKGTLQEYTLKLNSDLEKVVSSALQRAVAGLTRQFEQDLNTALQAKIKTPQSSLENDVDSLGGVNRELSGRKNFADTLLKKAALPSPQKGGLKIPF